MSICAIPAPAGSVIGTVGGNSVVAVPGSAVMVVDPTCGPNSYRLHGVAETSALTVQDGVSLGWMVGAVWLSVWGVSFITRYIWHEATTSDKSTEP